MLNRSVLTPAVLCALAMAVAVSVAAGQEGSATEAEDEKEPSAPQDTIEEVIVEGRRLDTDFDQRDLEAIAGSGGDPLVVLDIVPGVTLPADSDGPQEGFYIRGSDRDDNLVWADRQWLGYLFHLGAPSAISVVNPALVESFDLDLAAFDVSNPDRLGGVVAIQLRKPATDRLHQTYRVGLLEASFLIEGPAGDGTSFWLSGRRSYFDLILPEIGLEDFEESEELRIVEFPNYYDFQGRWRMSLEDGFMDLTFLSAGDQLKLELYNVEGRDPAQSGELAARVGFQSLQYRWHRNLSPEVSQLFDLTLFRDVIRFNLGTQQAGDLNPGQPFTLTNDNLALDISLRWERDLPDGNLLTYGADLVSVDNGLDGYLTTPPGEDAGVAEEAFGRRDKVRLDEEGHYGSTQLYAGWDFGVATFWRMHLGTRLANYGRDFTDTFVASRFGLTNQLGPSMSLGFRFGTHAQRPAGIELSHSLGNPDTLRLQKSTQSSLLWEWEPDSAHQLQAEIWHKEFDDLVVRENGSCNRCYGNLGDGSATGLDLIWRFARDDAQAYISYGYITTERGNAFNADEFPASADQPHSLVVAWYQPFGGSSRWSWSVRAGVYAGQPYTPIIGREMAPPQIGIDGEALEDEFWYPIYGELNSERLPTLLDIDLSFERRTVLNERGGEVIFRLDLLNISSLFYENTTEYDYGENFENTANPEPINDAFFVPNVSFEWNF